MIDRAAPRLTGTLPLSAPDGAVISTEQIAVKGEEPPYLLRFTREFALADTVKTGGNSFNGQYDMTVDLTRYAITFDVGASARPVDGAAPAPLLHTVPQTHGVALVQQRTVADTRRLGATSRNTAASADGTGERCVTFLPTRISSAASTRSGAQRPNRPHWAPSLPGGRVKELRFRRPRSPELGPPYQ
ncbi:hypothetical protein [Kitasatospora griseola]|uniref:hypothetical protein n=1 Tax=Kitasatospora griseola TaxID=2064 RepID=UPI003425F2FB